VREFLNLTRPTELAIDPAIRLQNLMRMQALFQLALIAATWPLWTGDHKFPQVPLLPGVRFPFIENLCLALLVVAAAAMVLSGRRVQSAARGRWPLWTALASGILLSVTNQHRLQPWHWLFQLLLLATLWFRPAEAVRLLRHILCALYICSALSRITPNPEQGIAGTLVRDLLRLTGFEIQFIDRSSINQLCHALVIIETLTGILLMFRRTRVAGIMLAVCIHMLLLLGLGPFGLNHQAAVLIWNISLLFSVPLLFFGDSANSNRLTANPRPGVAAAVCLVWAFPFSGLLDGADNWLSWQVYSPRPEHWTLMLHKDDVADISSDLRPFLGSTQPFSDWVPLRIDQLSLKVTHAPMYPEDRFQLAVTESLLNRLPTTMRFKTEISEPEPLRWWIRRHRVIQNRESLSAERSRLILNSRAAE
jgi:hypothetical protein